MTTDDSQQPPQPPPPDTSKQLEEGRKAFIVAPDVAIPPVATTEPMGGMPAPEPTMTAPVTAEPPTPPAVPENSD